MGIYFLLPKLGLGQTQGQVKNGKKPGNGADRPLLVTAVASHKGDIDIYVTGLGTITAYNTVPLRTCVYGELVKVAFTERPI